MERVHERRSREAIGPVSESGGWLREGDLGIEIVYFGFDKSNNELVLMCFFFFIRRCFLNGALSKLQIWPSDMIPITSL